jgi:hypothetical protein
MDEETRDPEGAVEEIREKKRDGEEPDRDEYAFLEGERVEVEFDEEDPRSPYERLR